MHPDRWEDELHPIQLRRRLVRKGSTPVCHVLIIEDEPFIAMSIQMALEEEGATSFDFAVTGAEAVAAALARPAELITSDVKLI